MEERNPSPLGTLLRRYRREAGLTQEELAEQAQISARAISDLERGVNRTACRDTVRLLADVLGLTGQERANFEAAAHRSGATAPTGSGGALQTFLLADIRDYTRFTAERGDEAAAQLTARFAELAEGVVEVHGGRVIELRGDEVLAAFSSARQALRASLELRTRFGEEIGRDLPVEVGIGLDAGDAVPVKGGYRTGALNLAARLQSLARGEVFATETVVRLAGKTEGIAFIDRGAVPLKGFLYPVEVIQIAEEGERPEELPPLHPTLAPHPTNLPVPPTPFIGREREVAAVAAFLRDNNVRLLTLTGPGGAGKTRLAIQAAQELLPAFPDGVVFVPLASIADPSLVASTLAAVLEVKEAPGRSLVEALQGSLREKQLLLVLDNFEHLLPAATLVSELLAACRDLKVLVTSRAVLHLAAECDYAVPPLAVPDRRHLPSLGTLIQYDAVALFVERARAAKASFSLTEENAAAVVEICRRLDGLPLAIELAAARIRIFSPQALLGRLSDRLQLLTGGPRDAPARQRTLRSTIDWSYHLLSPEEQTLFACLSVFAGGCTLEAAEAVCNPEGHMDLLPGLTSLVEQSLVWQEGEEEPRFRMLETVREYAGEKLAEHGADVQTRGAHGRFYLELAQEAEPELRGASQGGWFDRLEGEHDNLRAALRWLLERGQIEEVLHLAAILHRFWLNRAYSREGLRWLEVGLAQDEGVDGTIRARALYVVADLLDGWGEKQRERAIRLLEEALRLSREVGDRQTTARALRYLGVALRRKGDLPQAGRCLEESLGLFCELGDRCGMGDALRVVGSLAYDRGDFETAVARSREALGLAREIGDKGSAATELNNLGCILMEQGQYGEASALLEESLALTHELDRKDFLMTVLDSLGCVAMRQGDLRRAAELFTEGLSLSHDPRNKEALPYVLGHMAELAVLQGKAWRAARLAGAAAAGQDATAAYIDPVEQEHRERVMGRAQQELREDAWTRAWEAGRAMSLEEAVAYALGESEKG